MEWLEPWWSAETQEDAFLDTFRKQLELEVPPGHVLYGVPVKPLGRGNGDDSLFGLLDGSGRVALVHLTWAKRQEILPWPGTIVFETLEEFTEKNMRPQHQDWLDD